jgi:geranylgeranyl pyrophosphate synthase
MQIYNRYNVKNEATKLIQSYTEKALEALSKLDLHEEKKTTLKAFAQELMQREV